MGSWPRARRWPIGSRGRGLPSTRRCSIAQQIAEALDAAHEKGIVHRDLKPANIKITPDGVVKVLDFGLAKASRGDGSTPDLVAVADGDRAADARRASILGTAAYMSPEQARGQAVDKRTDIWAFGCVLYEMLTGHGAFKGETSSDTIVAVLGARTGLGCAARPRRRRACAPCCDAVSRRIPSAGCAISATHGSNSTRAYARRHARPIAPHVSRG